MEKRWGNDIRCPYCSNDAIYHVKGIQPYKCAACKRKFTAKTGTIMEGRPIGVRMWLLAMYLMGVSRKGISSIQLAKQVGVTQKTAWYMAHRIREACIEFEKLRGIVEVDETYGTFHHVSKKHLQRYINEFCFRSNIGLALSFIDAVCLQSSRGVLQYKQLTK